MGIFATRTRRGAQVEVAPGVGPVPDLQALVPARFEAVAERLAAGQDASVACSRVGRLTARDGADLGEALDGLRTTYARVQGGEPGFRALRALCQAWSEETLGYLHQLSCEDPLTGLASLAHLRARLSEVHRGTEQGGESMTTSHALVVLDLPLPVMASAGTAAGNDPFEAALRLVRVARIARLVFPGEETICQASSRRLVVMVARDTRLARRVGLLRDLVEDLDPQPGRARVWIEGLPSSEDGVALLLDEVARG
jgi:hypothetical protein